MLIKGRSLAGREALIHMGGVVRRSIGELVIEEVEGWLAVVKEETL